MSLSGVELGSFSSELMNYSATVDFDVGETAVEAVAADAGAALLLSGAGGTSQGGRRTVPLSVGLNVITITVTAQTGIVNTYSVVVFRTMSLTPGDASLSFLSLSGINIGNFTSTVTEYAAVVAHTLETTRVTALPADDNASVVIRAAGGADSTEGRQKDVALAQGRNTIVITVAAPEGTTQTYSVVVTRAEPPQPKDDEAAPEVTLVLSDTSIAENGGTAAVAATLSQASSKAVVVTVTAAAVFPAAAEDFTQSGSTLTIAAGDKASTGKVTITANDNDVDAPDKEVTVSASVAGGAVAKAPSDVALVITDDDAAPGVTLVLTPDSIAEDGEVSTVTATLSHVSSEETVVTVSAAPVSPALAADFTLSGTTLTIAAGATVSTGTVTITAVDNTVDALDKSVTVSAAAANSQGITAPGDQTLSITDDDAASTSVTLTVAPDEVSENAGAAVTLTVTGTLDAGTRNTVTVVTLAVAAGTATLTDDYTATGATLTITARQSSASATLTVTPENDGVAEGPEDVQHWRYG